MTEKLISIEGIAKRYPAPGGGQTAVFEDLWLAISRGEFVCMIGGRAITTVRPFRATPRRYGPSGVVEVG